MNKLFLAVSLLILVTACAYTISDNATVKMHTYGGFIIPEYGVQYITVNNTHVLYQIFSTNGSLTKEYISSINQSTYSNLIQLFRKVNFLQLNDIYGSATPNFDIPTTEISLIQYGITKTVKIEPEAKVPEGLTNITYALSSIAESILQQNPELTQLKFQPMQCEQTPWNKWYAEGNIQFIMAPTEEQLVVSYYSNKYNITIMDFEKVEPGLAVCEACSVCPQDYYINAKVKSSDADALIAEGWVEI